MGAVLTRLPGRELRAGMRALGVLAEQSASSIGFVNAALEELTGVVASDLTTLSICDLERGSRRVVGRKARLCRKPIARPSTGISACTLW